MVYSSTMVIHVWVTDSDNDGLEVTEQKRKKWGESWGDVVKCGNLNGYTDSHFDRRTISEKGTAESLSLLNILFY